MESLLTAIFSNINPVDIIFPVLFITSTTIMVISFVKVVHQDHINRKGNEDPQNYGSSLEAIYLKSDREVQTEINYSIDVLHPNKKYIFYL